MIKKNKVIIVFLLVLMSFIFYASSIYADFWDDANKWYNGDEYTSGSDAKNSDIGNISSIAPQAKEIIDDLSTMLNILGTTVFVIVTIYLGIKYMFGTFETKADVKENLITLLVACVLFFGWTAIWNILFTGGEFVLTKGTSSYESVIAKVFNATTTTANFLAIGAVLYIGIRYIFAGANGKADLKAKSGQFIIGIILAFCAVGFLNLVSTIISQVFG